MLIIGLDYHPSVQQIAFVDQETGEYGERRLAPHRRRSREVLSWPEAASNQGARGNGGHRKYALVRAADGGTGLRAVDRRPTPDSSEASTKAKNRSPGCATAAEVAPGGSLS